MIKLALYVEGILTSSDSDKWWLGQTISVGLTKIDETDKDKFKPELLCPWEWTVQWNAPSTTVAPEVPDPISVEHKQKLKDWINDQFAIWKAKNPAQPLGRPFRIEMSDESGLQSDEDKFEEEGNTPVWPGLLMQFARLDPRISHNLNIAQVFKVSEPDTFDATAHRVFSVTVAGVTFLYAAKSDQSLPHNYELKNETGDMLFEVF